MTIVCDKCGMVDYWFAPDEKQNSRDPGVAFILFKMLRSIPAPFSVFILRGAARRGTEANKVKGKNMTENQNTTSGQSGTTFNFSTVFWEKTTVLFGFYWLFRWLWPSILPESLRTADFHMQMLVCGAGGLVFTLFAAFRHVVGGQPKPGQK
jgi:hypothetical protein